MPVGLHEADPGRRDRKIGLLKTAAAEPASHGNQEITHTPAPTHTGAPAAAGPTLTLAQKN